MGNIWKGLGWAIVLESLALTLVVVCVTLCSGCALSTGGTGEGEVQGRGGFDGDRLGDGGEDGSVGRPVFPRDPRDFEDGGLPSQDADAEVPDSSTPGPDASTPDGGPEPVECTEPVVCENGMSVYADIAAFEQYTFEGNGEVWMHLRVGSHDIVRWEVVEGDFHAEGGSSCNGTSPTHVQLVGGVQKDVYVHVIPVFTDSCDAWRLEVTLEY